MRAEVELMRASAEGARSELEREMAARKENDQVIFCQKLVILYWAQNYYFPWGA